MSYDQNAYVVQAKKDYQQKELEKLGLTPEDGQHEQIVAYLCYLYYGAVEQGLLPKKDVGSFFVRYFCDSIQPLLLFGFKNKASVVTLSSGVGFPAVPIAIFRPDLHVTLVEEDAVKRTFLQECVAVVGLTNVTVAPEGVASISAQFDYVVQRGADKLQGFTRIGKELVTPEGRLYTFRTEAFEEELSDITMNKEEEGVCVSEIAQYDLANQIFGLNLVAFELY